LPLHHLALLSAFITGSSKGVIMRLTKTHREAFVRAAMQDVPQIDYDEQINKLVQDYLDKICPAELMKAYKNEKTRGYLRSTHVKVYNYERRYFNLVPCEDYVLPSDIQEKVNELFKSRSTQYQNNRNLKEKLEAAISAFTTRKAALDAMPEFEKYLPSEMDQTMRNLPAVANLVSDLVAAGWPKQKAKSEAKKRAKK